jgi:4-amino-4-deoxy-L-arabinose transferase-like glycosyltransferase
LRELFEAGGSAKPSITLAIARRAQPGLAMLVVLTLGLLVLGKGINEAPLVDWDEATYAEVAHGVVAQHSYVNLTFNAESYLKKPPLLFWAVAASFKTFGESEFSARLPAVLAGLGTLSLMYSMAAADFGILAGLIAGTVPLCFYYFVARGGRECATDGPLILFSTLAIFALDRSRFRRGWILVAGIACGLALMSKGAAGLIPLGVAVIALIGFPAFSKFRLTGLLAIVAASVIVAGPWFAYQIVHNGPVFWTTYVRHETLARIVKHLEDKPAAAESTVDTFKREVRFLWPLLLPLAAVTGATIRRSGWNILWEIPVSVMIWLLWFAIAFASACAVQTKLGWYVLPALIPVALLSAATLAGAFIQARSGQRYCRPLAVAGLLLLPFPAAAKLARVNSEFAQQRARSRPSYEMAMRAVAFAAIRGGGELYFAGPPLPTMVYYSGLRCHFVSPSEPDFELADLGGNPISVSYHELVLRDPNGTVTAVDNFDDEWNASAPLSERVRALDEAVDPQSR